MAVFHKGSTLGNFKNLTRELFRFSEAMTHRKRFKFRTMLKTNQSQCDDLVSIFYGGHPAERKAGTEQGDGGVDGIEPGISDLRARCEQGIGEAIGTE